MKVNWNTVATTLTGIAIVAFLGGVWDFQNIKAEVKNNTRQIGVAATLLCSHAIDQSWRDAKLICNGIQIPRR